MKPHDGPPDGGANPPTPDVSTLPVPAFLDLLAGDLNTLAMLLRGPSSVRRGDGTERIRAKEAAALSADKTAEIVRTYARALPAAELAAPLLGWQPIASAEGVSDALVSGRYASGRWFVAKTHRHADGHWIGFKNDPPSHWMPIPAPPAGTGPGLNAPAAKG